MTQNSIRITTPLTAEAISQLHMGQMVLVSGTIYTARDAAHARFVDALSAGQNLPVNLQGQIIYYAGPSPAKPGSVIGSCGPTTSGRMDSFTPTLIHQAGLAGMIGKGPRSQAVIDAMKQAGCVYFAAIGGAAALIAESVQSVEVIAYDDLGPEAVRKLEVIDYPCVVAIDAEGNNIYEQGPMPYKRDTLPVT